MLLIEEADGNFFTFTPIDMCTSYDLALSLRRNLCVPVFSHKYNQLTS